MAQAPRDGNLVSMNNIFCPISVCMITGRRSQDDTLSRPFYSSMAVYDKSLLYNQLPVPSHDCVFFLLVLSLVNINFSPRVKVFFPPSAN